MCDDLRNFYHFYTLKKVKNTHRGVLLLVKLQASAFNFIKSNTLPWAFFTFLNCSNSTNLRKRHIYPATLFMHDQFYIQIYEYKINFVR